jgi:hypothetical protein
LPLDLARSDEEDLIKVSFVAFPFSPRSFGLSFHALLTLVLLVSSGHEVGTGPAFIAAATPNPYDNGDQHSGPRPTFRDILQPKKKLASDEGLTWKVAAMNVVKASWLNVLVRPSFPS